MPLTKEQFVMIISDMWPEELKLFLLEEGSLSDNCYINGDKLPDNHPLLNEKLVEALPFEGTSTKDQHITAIYRCGWYL